MPNSSSNQKTSADITEQAAEWLILLEDDQTQDTLTKYQKWLTTHPEHPIAIERIQKLIGDVESITEQYVDKDTSKNILAQGMAQQQKTRSTFRKSILSITLLGSAVLLTALQYAPIHYWMADQRNGSQSWQQHSLEDQSQIKVAGKTAYNIQYTNTQRKVELLQGNILVDVAKDKNRPFLVETKHGTIQALGTRFIVTQDGQKTIVTMLESKTAIWGTQYPEQKIELVAGERFILNGQQVISSQPIGINTHLIEQAWQQHTLVANGSNLVDVLDELSQYYDGKLQFDRPSLSKIKVTATLPLGDIEQALQQIANELNLNINQPIPYLIIIKINK